MVESISETFIDMIGKEPSKAENDKKSWPPLERGEWPLIDYDRSEVKSAQELLFEVICIYLTLTEIYSFSSNTPCAGSLGKRSSKKYEKMARIREENKDR
jgi:hypothetical protein